VLRTQHIDLSGGSQERARTIHDRNRDGARSAD
jgi:hypothetical protein